VNWRGRPLVGHAVIVDRIGTATTRAGRRVQAALDAGPYPTKLKVSDEEMAGLSLTPHPFHGERDYTLTPRPTDPQTLIPDGLYSRIGRRSSSTWTSGEAMWPPTWDATSGRTPGSWVCQGPWRSSA